MPSPFKVKVVVASSLLVWTSACFGTVNRTLPDSTKPAPELSEYVHLKMRNGDTLTLQNAAIRNDSLIGARVNERVVSNPSYAVATASVQSYSAQKLHKGRTILLVSVVFLTLMSVIGAGAVAGSALASDGGY